MAMLELEWLAGRHGRQVGKFVCEGERVIRGALRLRHVFALIGSFREGWRGRHIFIGFSQAESMVRIAGVGGCVLQRGSRGSS